MRATFRARAPLLSRFSKRGKKRRTNDERPTTQGKPERGPALSDLDVPAELAALRDATTAFVMEQVVPVEAAVRDAHGPDEELRRSLQAKAREAGVFGPAVPREFGGQGPGW